MYLLYRGIEAPSARKFFWSTVDRLSNSFADEIPSHVLKCRHCPAEIKDALLVLKEEHSDQMQMLPRGSQKVFLRRVWRRLHYGDREVGGTARCSSSRQNYPDLVEVVLMSRGNNFHPSPKVRIGYIYTSECLLMLGWKEDAVETQRVQEVSVCFLQLNFMVPHHSAHL